VDVQEYRGGLKMEHAIEQRQINEQYTYTGYWAARRASRWLGW
jgi:hypothetical protein